MLELAIPYNAFPAQTLDPPWTIPLFFLIHAAFKAVHCEAPYERFGDTLSSPPDSIRLAASSSSRATQKENSEEDNDPASKFRALKYAREEERRRDL